MSNKSKMKRGEPLGEARQVRFQKSVDDEINKLADREGTDFPTVVRMAVRRGIAELKKSLSDAA